MDEDRTKIAFGVATVLGAIIWLTTSALTGRREPWDAPQFWTVAYPIAIACGGVLGYLFPVRPWRWVFVLMFMQGVVMIFGGSGLGLLPLGLILLAILALPAVGAGYLGARLSPWRDRPDRPS